MKSKPLRDVLAVDLRILFCGINPSLLSAERGHHFARPGNRFWKALHLSGFTPRLLTADEDGLLPEWGLGITNLVDRPTRGADELSVDEYRAGTRSLTRLVACWQPSVLGIVGLQAWRLGFRRPRAGVGLQREQVAGRPVWVVPNPSGLNAHYQVPDLARLYRDLWVYSESQSR